MDKVYAAAFFCCGAVVFIRLAAAEVPPVFEARCVACHGASPQARLDLRTEASALKGGVSGPVVTPGAVEKSLIFSKVITGQMPLGKPRLTDAEIDQIRTWIDHGIALPAASPVSEPEVRAILQARCVICHGSTDRKGGLDLRTMAGRLQGGKSGPALVPGKPEESLLYRRIVNGEMPPDKLAKELAVELPTAAETEKIRAWIAQGAPAPHAPSAAVAPSIREADRNFWSFQPPRRPAVPRVQHAALVRNPIDAFLLQKLEAKGLVYSPEADRLTLLRRVYLDLTGLPPTPAETGAFRNDHSPDAYEKLVDRLLGSPHYGERWAQHWLDLAGYSDSEGFGNDDNVRPSAWRYRDYVIRSFNDDKPYTRFLTEQIAGDELSNDWKNTKTASSQEMIDRLAATGFLRTVPDPTDSNERGLLAERMNVLADEVEVLTSSVMGLTVGCARCHDHKYDPIPQHDYYRLSAILQAAYDPYEWRTPKKRELDLSLETELKQNAIDNAPVQAEVDRLVASINDIAEPYKKMAIAAGIKGAEGVKADTDFPLRKNYPEYKTRVEGLHKELVAARAQLQPPPHIRVLMDQQEPSVSYLLRRGNPVGFGDPVEPGVPEAIQNSALKPYEPVSPFPGSSGRRLALAHWMTQPNHPLTARVAINQLWMRHFGQGIVASVANFGHSGVPPSHPELLDWLATEFVRQGWSIKAMHRLMVTSQAYRQTSRVDGAVILADPENVLVSRMPMQRMDAESLYDSLLTVAGRLDPAPFGKPSVTDVHADGEVTALPTKAGLRRSIYVLHKRGAPVSLMDAFDQPAMTPNCTERRRSNVATQALQMMNGSMTWQLARYMAGRVIDEAGNDPTRQIERIYLRTFARPPLAAEIAIGKQAIEGFENGWPMRLDEEGADAPRAAAAKWLALANYCHALLNSAEFSFID